MEVQVRLFVDDELLEHPTDTPFRQVPREQMVVTDADDLGGQQHHDLGP